MRNAIGYIAAGLAALALATGAEAKTPDGRTPAEETVCDGLEGKLFGLCNAYCEAMDCDSSVHKAAEQACRSVLRNFMKESEGHEPPCIAWDETGPRGEGGPAD